MSARRQMVAEDSSNGFGSITSIERSAPTTAG
jgi:hypothetical protein